MWKDFKDFAFKGNVVDLAVGVIIGGAFGKIVKAIVDDLVMPTVSLALPSGDWRNAAWTLRTAGPAGPEGDVRVLLGDFVGVTIDFLVVAMVLFFAVRLIQRARGDEPKLEPTTRECPACLEAIPKKATRCRACTSEVPAVA